MALSFIPVILFISLIITLITPGTAIKCYTCSSIRDKRCADDFVVPNGEASECPGTCYRFRGEKWEGSVKVVELFRGCRQQTTKYCEDRRYNGIPVDACYCNTDYCNSATLNSPSFIFISLITLFSIFTVLQRR